MWHTTSFLTGVSPSPFCVRSSKVCEASSTHDGDGHRARAFVASWPALESLCRALIIVRVTGGAAECSLWLLS